MRNDKVRQVANVLALVVTVIVNGLANGLPLNGQTTGEISDRAQVFFVPAGYVFSIWGLIYLGLAAFAVYQALPGQRANERLRRLGPWFVISCVFNSAWIFAWHYEQFALSVLIIVGLLASLIVIYAKLGIGRAPSSRRELFLVNAPFSIYLGWVTVATIANVTAFLFFAGWDGWGISPVAWTVVMLIAATAIAAAVGLTRADAAYTAVLVWAFVGIAVKHAGTPPVALASWVAAGVMTLVLVVSFLRSRAILQREGLAARS